MDTHRQTQTAATITHSDDSASSTTHAKCRSLAHYGEDSEDAIEFSTVLPAPMRRIHTASNFLSNKSQCTKFNSLRRCADRQRIGLGPYTKTGEKKTTRKDRSPPTFSSSCSCELQNSVER